MSAAQAKRMESRGLVSRLADGFANFVSGLGGGNAKVLGNNYVLNCSQQDLETAYRTSTWFGKIVDIPADDATREWRTWQAENDQIELLEATEKRLQVQQKVRQAITWSRLYGGAVIIPGGLPGNPSEPLPMERVKKDSIKFLTVLHRHDIQADGLIRDPMSELYGLPERFKISTGTGASLDIHPSRVIVVNGRTTGSRLGGQDFWGDSIWMHLFDSITSSDAGAAVIGALMQEAKTDVIRVPSMMSNMATAEYEALMIKRFQMVASLKGMSNVMLLDKDDEWDQKQITWNGIPDVMQTLLTIMAGAADIPVTRLIGTSAKGFNATGEGDLKNYYDNVKAKQTLTLTPTMTPLDNLLIRSALNDRPEDVWFKWEPLWQMDEKTAAEVDKLEAETSDIYIRGGIVPVDALAKTTQNRMVESGRWPGLEAALEESDLELELPEVEDPDEDNDNSQQQPRRRAANDAAPRTLYVRRDVLNAEAIISHFKAQGFETTLPQGEMHVTVLYSRTPVDWMQMGESWSPDKDGKFIIKPGGPRLMERFGDAVVLLFSSTDLQWRHADMIHRGASHDFSEYQPHVTISYEFDGLIDNIEPYVGEIVFGPEIFEEINENYQADLTEDGNED